MTASLQETLDLALSLSEDDRISLLLALMELLTPVKTDAEILTDDLKRELDRRLQFCDEHPDKLIGMAEGLDRIRKRMMQRRGA